MFTMDDLLSGGYHIGYTVSAWLATHVSMILGVALMCLQVYLLVLKIKEHKLKQKALRKEC